MNNTLPMTEARIHFGEVVKRVMTGERIVLEKGGIPVATIINREELEDLEDALELLRLREKHAGERGVPLDKIASKYGV
ncbi:type II toxin-antitoxin system prevent-host-death family antitoxin [Candidatus Kaiserbacteria bacterium]|nr:type II toxin-antitoxin system prevent-host-death family antitoxin [Candidatus Kaiserbacteria bacterium]